MSGKAVLLDLTSIVAQPYRSGIQRVERETLRHWPDNIPLIPCCFDDNGNLRKLPPAIFDVLLAPPDNASFQTDQATLARLASESCLLSDAGGILLNLELFFEATRAEAYLRLAGSGWSLKWLVYDFLPCLHPDGFSMTASLNMMHYLRALRVVGSTSFISEQTRCEYETRIMRNRRMGGPVLPLGADGLGLERQRFAPERRDFVSVGTMEPRKNTAAIIEAFLRLWAEGVDARLVLAGRLAADAERERELIDKIGDDPRFELLDQPTDALVRDHLRQARAIIFSSEREGFGLPPYEGLYCGIPAITSAHIPSMQDIPPRGRIALERADASGIAEAVRNMLDNDVAARLWHEAEAIALPTWREFATELAAWAQSE